MLYFQIDLTDLTALKGAKNTPGYMRARHSDTKASSFPANLSLPHPHKTIPSPPRALFASSRITRTYTQTL